jgi:flagellar biosynthesis protein FliQ
MTTLLIGLGKEALYMILLLSAPPVLAGLIVGLLISIVQAATQIQEQAVTQVPKLLAIYISLSIFGFWMFSRLVAFTYKIWYQLPALIH